jgi:hypothetical protein
MSHSNNPFVRGYDGLSVQRLLAISYDDDCPLSYLPLHVSQSHLPDSQVERHACVFCDDFALITEGQNVPPELDAQCRSHGIARNLVYAVMAEEAGQPLHVGDTYSEEAAREVVRRLRFETGFYSRAGKSAAHITEEAGRFLAELADIATPSGFLFVAFRIPYSPAVGVKLIATPWTDANLQRSKASPPKSCGRSTGPRACRSPSWKCCTWPRSPTCACWSSMPMRQVLDGLTLYDDE